MKQPNPFKSYLIALLLLSPFIAQANPVIPNPTAPNPIAPQPTAPKPTTPITTHPTTIPYSIAPLLPYIPQIGPDGRLVIPTAPLLPRYPTHYQDFFKKHKAYEYGAGLSLQEIGRIAQSKGYTLYSNRAFNEIASVLSPAPLWPEWAEKIRAVQRIDEGSIDTAGQLSKTGPQSKGDYLGYAYFGVIDKNNREGTQQTAFDAIFPDIKRHNRFADILEQQGITSEQAQKIFQQRDRAYNVMAEAERERLKEQRNKEIQQRKEQIDADRRADYIRHNFPKGVTPISEIQAQQPLVPYTPLPFEKAISENPEAVAAIAQGGKIVAVTATAVIIVKASGGTLTVPIAVAAKKILGTAAKGASNAANAAKKAANNTASAAKKGNANNVGSQAQKAPQQPRNTQSTTSNVNRGYTQNDIDHVFQKKHNFDSFLKNYNSKEEAFDAIYKSANKSLNPKTYQAGTWVTINVNGVPVAVKGVFVNGVFRIGTATMKPF